MAAGEEGREAVARGLCRQTPSPESTRCQARNGAAAVSRMLAAEGRAVDGSGGVGVGARGAGGWAAACCRR